MSRNWQIGNVVEIPLENRTYSYGVVVEEPLIAFSNLYFNEPQSSFEKLFEEPVFKIWVMKYAIGKRHWNVVGNVKVNIEIPVFYKLDFITKKYSLYFESMEKESSLEECIGLECAAVWDPEHVQERLLAISLGKESIWEKSLRAENKV